MQIIDRQIGACNPFVLTGRLLDAYLAAILDRRHFPIWRTHAIFEYLNFRNFEIWIRARFFN